MQFPDRKKRNAFDKLVFGELILGENTRSEATVAPQPVEPESRTAAEGPNPAPRRASRPKPPTPEEIQRRKEAHRKHQAERREFELTMARTPVPKLVGMTVREARTSLRRAYGEAATAQGARRGPNCVHMSLRRWRMIPERFDRVLGSNKDLGEYGHPSEYDGRKIVAQWPHAGERLKDDRLTLWV